MIISFGEISIGIETELSEPLGQNTHINAQSSQTEIHGTAALLAITSARAGAHVGIIGSIGKDIFADQITKAFRKEGIQTTGLSKTDHATGTITILKCKGDHTYILNAGANRLSRNAQIPDTSLGARTLLLLHSRFDNDENDTLIQRAKQAGAKTVLICEDRPQHMPEYAKYCDIIISDHKSPWKTRADTMFVQTRDAGLKGAIIKGDQYDSVLPQDQKEQDKSGAFEAFCGTFAACIQARTDVKNALNYATIAAQLTAAQTGTYASFPYLGDIEDSMKNV